MSKVFSAKKKEVEFEYEFLDGEKNALIATSLSSSEQVEVSALKADGAKGVADNFKSILRKQLSKNDEKIVKRVIKEQYENADLIEFSNSLSELVREAKKKK